MLSEFDKRRLFDICQAVKQLSEDGSLISVFGERLVNHVNKNEPYAYQRYYVIRNGNGQKEIFSLSNFAVILLKRESLLLGNSYSGIHQYVIFDFDMDKVDEYILNHCNFQCDSHLCNGIEKGSMQVARLHPTVNKRHQLPLCFDTETSSAG